MPRTFGTCSVCLGEHVLLGAAGSRPVRHGFSAQNVRHGESGGWHTGPCFGGDQLDLSASCDGTRQAEREATGHLASLRAAAARLAARPVLHWSETRGRGANAKTHARDLADGDAAAYSIPSYSDLHATRTREIAREIARVEQALVQYATVIREWAPGKWPTREDGGPVAVIHAPGVWFRSPKGGEKIAVGLCSAGSRERPFGQRLAAAAGEVTCMRCRAAIASADKERARRAAVMRYSVMLPDGTVERTTNEERGTKRPLVAAVLAMRAARDELPARWVVDAWCVSLATARKAEREARAWASEVRVVALQPSE